MRPKYCSTPCRTSRASCLPAWSRRRQTWSWPRGKDQDDISLPTAAAGAADITNVLFQTDGRASGGRHRGRDGDVSPPALRDAPGQSGAADLAAGDSRPRPGEPGYGAPGNPHLLCELRPGQAVPPDPPAQELPRRAGPVHVPGPRTAEGQPGAGPAQSQAHRERPAGLKALAGGPPSPAPAVTLTVPLTSGWRNRPGCIRAR